MAEQTTDKIFIDADPGTVLEVIADIDKYPEWISEYKEAEVQQRGEDGRPKIVRFVMDAGVIKDTLVMSYTWPADRKSLSWTLVSSSLLKSVEGSYHLAAKDSGTEVTYALTVDLAIPMIGLIKRKAERRLTDRSLKDLKKRVEG